MLAASSNWVSISADIINLRDMSRLVTDRVQRFRLSAIVRHCRVFLFLKSVPNHSSAENRPFSAPSGVISRKLYRRGSRYPPFPTIRVIVPVKQSEITSRLSPIIAGMFRLFSKCIAFDQTYHSLWHDKSKDCT